MTADSVHTTADDGRWICLHGVNGKEALIDKYSVTALMAEDFIGYLPPRPTTPGTRVFIDGGQSIVVREHLSEVQDMLDGKTPVGIGTPLACFDVIERQAQQIENQMKTVAALDDLVESLQSDLKSARSRESELAVGHISQQVKMAKQNDDLRKDYNSIWTELNRVREELAESEAARKALAAAVDEKSARIAQYTKDIDYLGGVIDRVEKARCDTAEELRKSEETRNQLLSRGCRDFGDIQERDRTIESLRKSLVETTKKLNECIEERDKMHAERDRAVWKLNTLVTPQQASADAQRNTTGTYAPPATWLWSYTSY